MKSTSKINIGAKCALFGAALIWGSSFFIMKNAVAAIPTNTVLAIRFTLACIFLSILFHKKLKLINMEYVKDSLVIALCLFIAYYTQTLGIARTTPGKNAFLTATYCIIVPFLFWFVNKNRPSIKNFIAAIFCLCGIGFVSLTEGFSIGLGDSLSLVGGIFFAMHMVAVAKFTREKDPILITIMQFGFCAIFSWGMSIGFETIPSFSTWDSGMIFEMLYLTFLATATAMLLQNIGQKYTNPSSASIILSLESVFGVMASVIFYGEVLTGKLILGFILIFFAVLISEVNLPKFNARYACNKSEI